MILLLGGAQEGREIAGILRDRGYSFIVSVTDEYGRRLLADLPCRRGKLDKDGLRDFIGANNINLVIDATHPYAVEISANAISVCEEKDIKYIRFERESIELPTSPLIHTVDNFEQAARLSAELGRRIFLTTGSNNLEIFVKEASGAIIFARVLPHALVIEKCSKLLPASQLIAVQGPHSKEFNRALFKEYKADVIVTKESGDYGGTLDKINAAVELNIAIIVIKRPILEYPALVNSYQELLTTIELLQ